VPADRNGDPEPRPERALGELAWLRGLARTLVRGDDGLELLPGETKQLDDLRFTARPESRGSR
jgi:hypothetical protein